MDSAGRYFASFVVETNPDVLPDAEPMIGIDLGLAHFVAPTWPSLCMTPGGRRSCTCWSTRPAGTGGSSSGLAASSPHPGCARPAGLRTAPSRCTSELGSARVAERGWTGM
jgi:hypothetical protein